MHLYTIEPGPQKDGYSADSMLLIPADDPLVCIYKCAHMCTLINTYQHTQAYMDTYIYTSKQMLTYLLTYMHNRGGSRIFIRGRGGLLFTAKVENQKKKVFHTVWERGGAWPPLNPPLMHKQICANVYGFTSRCYVSTSYP